jgi:hypothetical protein
MRSRFEATVSALAETIVREHCGGARAGDGDVQAAVARFLLATHARMADYMRLPFLCLTVLFDLWALPTAGQSFHRLPHAERWRQICAWRQSTLGFRRDLIKFYETLAIFGWYAELYGQDYAHELAT